MVRPRPAPLLAAGVPNAGAQYQRPGCACHRGSARRGLETRSCLFCFLDPCWASSGGSMFWSSVLGVGWSSFEGTGCGRSSGGFLTQVGVMEAAGKIYISLKT